MDGSNPLEHLSLLEKKVVLLIDIIKAEKTLTNQLIEERNMLTARLEMMENSLLKETKGVENLNQERILTKMMVDELISCIDQLVEDQGA
ncbi:hypothetical protein H0W26_02245 [Candidatus Dependentiae bacterium]|nr:hypothetical protein [Candidatus Dependentiae bacterium]